jgi:hypothetical protein
LLKAAGTINQLSFLLCLSSSSSSISAFHFVPRSQKKTFALLEERDWSNISLAHRPTQIQADVQNVDARELHLNVTLPAGLGLSIVSCRPAEELIFARFADITLDIVNTPANKRLYLNIQDVQIDNQLFEAQCTSVLYISR